MCSQVNESPQVIKWQNVKYHPTGIELKELTKDCNYNGSTLSKQLGLKWKLKLAINAS